MRQRRTHRKRAEGADGSGQPEAGQPPYWDREFYRDQRPESGAHDDPAQPPGWRESPGQPPGWYQGQAQQPDWREDPGRPPGWRDDPAQPPGWRESPGQPPGWREGPGQRSGWREGQGQPPGWREDMGSPSAWQHGPADGSGQVEEPAKRPRRGRRAGTPRQRRRPAILVIALAGAVLIAGLGAAGGGYLLLRTKGSPQQTAAAYLRAWQQGDYQAMNAVSVRLPRHGVGGWLTQASAQLGVRSTHLTLRRVTVSGGTALARFTAADVLAGGHVWTYQGLLRLLIRDRRWLVNWSPAAIYPSLRAGERFALSGGWPARAPVLGADGTVLSSASAVAESGSIALLTGVVARATAARAKALGAPYKAGDPIGLGGIEQAYQARLAGRPSLTVRILGPGRRVDRTVARFASSPGLPVRTSIEMFVQRAASAAVAAARTTKPVDMVVVQPSTGRVLAVVERPGGFDRALAGIYPPGSTFKVVTASALARAGLTPSSQVPCPSQVTIDGRTFHNDANEHLGVTSLLNAFAVSCNSTFVLLATQRLTGNALAAMAASYGFNVRPALGIPAKLGAFSLPRSPVDLAADAFGQGADLVNPLSQAVMAAAVADGTWRPPRLVISPAPRQLAKPQALSGAVLAALRPMMRAVVTSGTAAGVGFGPGVYGKTGTAEYLVGTHLRSHGWFIGYRGDLAFAVLVEGGGFGASSAGPIANAFLHRA